VSLKKEKKKQKLTKPLQRCTKSAQRDTKLSQKVENSTIHSKQPLFLQKKILHFSIFKVSCLALQHLFVILQPLTCHLEEVGFVERGRGDLSSLLPESLLKPAEESRVGLRNG